jgi:IclR family acetate operon transcriptional repressor
MVTEADRQIAGRYTVQSVARALRLVEIVADGPPGGLSLSELSRALGTSKSSTLALARTLVAFGYLRYAHPGPGYTLGTGLIRLGDIVGQQLPLGELCRPRIEELSRATKMTSRVAINDNGYPVFVQRVDGPGSVRFYTPLGQRELPYASAAGKAILSAMDEGGIRRMCAETGLSPRTAHTITDIDTLLDNLAVARRLGFAVDDEEDAEGVFCVGAAFFGHDGSCAGAVSVTGIKGDLPAWRIDELGRIVRRYADDVSDMLGGSPYTDLGLAVERAAAGQSAAGRAAAGRAAAK